jgi:hypothetical protein
MKVISKLLMFALVLSVFTGCKKEEENLPLEGIAGTYEGTITLNNPASSIPNVPITIQDVSGNKVSLNVPGTIFQIEDVKAECTVTSTKDSYSIEGSITLEKITIGEQEVAEVKIEVKDSNISASGKAVINMEASSGGVSLMTIKFDGQKK